MAATKKAPARKKAEPKEPEPPQVEGFTTTDYEGMHLFVCERCGFDTFDEGATAGHLKEHDRTDAAAAELEDITEHLAERAQVEVTDEG